jgi:chemotaxis protein MotB
VMWLINATDGNKKKQIATYFNPIKLPDQQKAERALQTADSHGGENQEAVKERRSPKGQQNIGAGEKEAHEAGSKGGDEALFSDPYGILSKIAMQAVKVPLPAGGRDDAAPQFSGGPAFRDPFDPDFRKRAAQHDGPIHPPSQRDQQAEGAGEDEGTMPTEIGVGPGEDAPGKTPGKKQAGQQQAAEQQAAATPPAADANPQAPAQKAVPSATPGNVAAAQAPAKELETAIKQVLDRANLQETPDITVQHTSEGILISLTDKLNFEMFNVSSAQPRPELVVAMERIGKLLQSRGEKIVVRGHTDARPFRSGPYDNWRLSSDRANIAHHMLVRGGLPEQRFIEILLRQPST